MIDLIWNLFQDADIVKLQAGQAEHGAATESSRSTAQSVATRLSELEQRHEQLKLVTLSLWRLLQDRGELSEANLRSYVTNTDLLDGALDGKVDLLRELVECTACQRQRLNTALTCPWCGHRDSGGGPFDRA